MLESFQYINVRIRSMGIIKILNCFPVELQPQNQIVLRYTVYKSYNRYKTEKK